MLLKHIKLSPSGHAKVMIGRSLAGLVFTLVLTLSVRAQQTGMLTYQYQHPDGRQFVPRGFVLNTEDLHSSVHYIKEDFLRIARMGANYQVIRLDMARLGAWPGYTTDETYLKELDQLVAMAKEFGISTGFKLTVYRIRGFGEKGWTKLWLNEDDTQEYLINGWKKLWIRYKDEPYVFAYDLLNEPHKGEANLTYDEVQAKYLMPLYRKMIDSLQIIDKKKWALYQPLLMEMNPDRAKRKIPFWEMKEDIKRQHVMFAPHMYQLDTAEIGPTLSRYASEASLSKAPMFLGEWGSATYDHTDIDILEQQRYERAYIKTAEIADSLGLGTIKAWFLGSRWKGTNQIGKFTWAIFQDSVAVGTAERKYITDIIARPYPSFIAGTLHSFNYDFALRRLYLSYKYRKGSNSEIFVGANRHYPDGFTVSVNNGEWEAFYDPIKSKSLEVLKTSFSNGVKISWDERLQKLLIQQLPKDHEDYTIMISPGKNN